MECNRSRRAISRGSIVSFLLAGVAIVTLMWLFRGAGAGGAAGADPLPLPGTSVGEVAPKFVATTTDGAALNFPDDFRGKTVLLDFWATWCPPCRAELPHLRQVYQTYRGRGVEIIGISLDESGGVAPNAFRDFLTSNGIAWRQVYSDTAAIATQFGIVAIPTAFLIDGDSGRVLARGAALSGHGLEAALERARPQ